MATAISGLSNSTPSLEQRLKLEINFFLEFVLSYPLIRLFLCRILLIDLVTVFDAIVTSRQTRDKLQCLYENLFSYTQWSSSACNALNFCLFVCLFFFPVESLGVKH